MIYRQFTAHPRLARVVACLWYLRKSPLAGASPDRVLPDGCMELVFNLRTPFSQADATGCYVRQPAAILVGQISRQVLLQATDETEVMAVRFRPAGAHAFFRLDLDELTDRWVALEELGRDWRELALRLGEAQRWDARMRLLEGELLRRIDRAPPGGGRAAAALDLLHGAETPPRIAQVARAAGLSTRQLERVFRREVGLTPKHYARLLRFRRMLGALDRTDPRWADLALQAGYSDQPHLVREFREFAGLTPRAYLAEQTPFAAALLG